MLLLKRDAQNSMDLGSYEMHSWESRAVEKLPAVCARLTLVETWGGWPELASHKRGA